MPETLAFGVGEYICEMKRTRLPSSALWVAVRSLREAELRRLRQRVKGTRWAWLLETLLSMESFSDEQLRQAYRAAFPEADERLLRVYKNQLWGILEEVVPTRQAEAIAEEVQLCQRLWLSVLFWRRGRGELAEVLWLQVMDEAVEKGWYEIALWGLTLLELYGRDLHRFAPGQSVSEWSRHLLGLIQARYEAITAKVAAAEHYVLTRSPKGWILPLLPERDEWSAYMSEYRYLLQAAAESDYERALSHLCEMLEILRRRPPMLSAYVEFHEAISWTNMGIILLNLGAWELYDLWYDRWQSAWKQGRWHTDERLESMYRVVLSLRFGYLLKTWRWRAARQLYDTQKSDLVKHIFHSTENLGFRVSTACGIYLVLLLEPRYHREPIEWRLTVQSWLDKEEFRDGEYLWWTFLRWYEAYLSGDRAWIRHWHRRLRKTWRMYFSHDERWIPILRFTWNLTEGLRRTWKRYGRRFLDKLRMDPAEARLWDNDAVIFPMRLFVEATLRGIPLAEIPSITLSSPTLPEGLESRVRNLLYSLRS